MTLRPTTVNGVTVRFGGQEVLSAITTTFSDRGVVGLVGPNGAGKSTFLDLLSGSITCSDGEIRDQNNQLLGIPALRRACARLHQNSVVPESSTPDEYLDLATRQRHLLGLVTAARVWKIPCVASASPLLISAQVAPGAGRPLARYSGGQRRIVALEAVLAQDVPVMLLDEPLSGLSDALSDAALDAIARTARERLVIMAEHRVLALQVVVDTTLVLRNGRLVATLGRGQLTAETFAEVSR